LLGEEGGKREGEERRVEEREMRNILVVYEFAEELRCSAKLLSIVAPHHFAKLVVEPDEECFLWFGSINNPKGLFVEPTVNALILDLIGGTFKLSSVRGMLSFNGKAGTKTSCGLLV
jgi:hypothetical protein